MKECWSDNNLYLLYLLRCITFYLVNVFLYSVKSPKRSFVTRTKTNFHYIFFLDFTIIDAEFMLRAFFRISSRSFLASLFGTFLEI